VRQRRLARAEARLASTLVPLAEPPASATAAATTTTTTTDTTTGKRRGRPPGTGPRQRAAAAAALAEAAVTGAAPTVCFVCQLVLPSGDLAAVNAHIDHCLARATHPPPPPPPPRRRRRIVAGSTGSGNDDADAEADGADTYTWAGVTRVRATSLLQGDFSGTVPHGWAAGRRWGPI
jgi:hypothetical protein